MITMGFDKKLQRLQVKKVLIFVPLFRQNLGAFLSPVLGQYGIRNVDFLQLFQNKFREFFTNVAVSSGLVEKFLELSVEVAERGEDSLSDLFDLIVPVYLVLYKSGLPYTLEIQFPHSGALLRKLVRTTWLRRVYYLNISSNTGRAAGGVKMRRSSSSIQFFIKTLRARRKISPLKHNRRCLRLKRVQVEFLRLVMLSCCTGVSGGLIVQSVPFQKYKMIRNAVISQV